MKNSMMMGALVLAIALVPSFASAASTSYAVDIGMTKNYLVPGTLLVQPTLDQDHGEAEIVSAVFLGTQWSVDVRCKSTSAVNCDGFILS